MSARREAVVIVCDDCGASFQSRSRTIVGARGDAERRGWRVSYLAGGRHPDKRSGDPRTPDRCPACRPIVSVKTGLLAWEEES